MVSVVPEVDGVNLIAGVYSVAATRIVSEVLTISGANSIWGVGAILLEDDDEN